MKRNWTFAVIALIAAVAAIVFAFLAGKKYEYEILSDAFEPDESDEPDEPDEPNKNQK
jgi:hypothetical protein